MPESELIDHAGLDSAVYLRIYWTGFWTHLVMAYVFTLWTCYVLKEYETAASMRLHFLASEQRRPDQFTVLVRNIPPDPDESVSRITEQFFLVNHPDHYLSSQIEEFVKTVPDYPLSSVGLIDAPKTLANIVESTIGAVYLDSNKCNNITSKVIKKLLQPIITPSTLVRHPVTLLFEICQKNGFSVEVLDLWNETGQIEIFIGNQFVGKGQYNIKKIIAYNRAAADAYNKIVRELDLNDD